MKSRITAYIEFSFKGELFAPAVTLDLDGLMETKGHVPELHSVIAQASGFDHYSYEYEMMEAEAVRFKAAEGLALEFFDGEQFDIEGFESRWQENRLMNIVQGVARKHLAIDDLQGHPELGAALRDAYLQGLSAGQAMDDAS